ncbi:MAG TPA: SusD/RagB family nutrient-binding outer membrane lipoprotein, partial [Ohtaekwangia sp.]|nr:SusD/RagB family nutrient-binding outer membrane lipoprotein [Ohtaekwangia sp.]
MKKTKISIFVLVLYLLAGCDAGFDEINTSKTGVIAINPAYLFNNAMIRTSFPQQTLVYELAIVQQMVTPNSGVVSGGNYNQDNRSVTQVTWQRYYRDVMKSVVDVIDATQDDPARSNLYNMARIWRAYAIMVLTDTYGDVPYTDAGTGFLSGNVTPKYDTQESIYMSILDELETASAALDADLTIETADIMYKGNIDQWKKFGYSLLLRAAMRLTEVDPQTANDYVDVAVAGGLMESNADNAVIRHVSTYQNDIGIWLTSTEAANFYLARPFVDYL